MLGILALVVLLFWIGGFAFHVLGGFIHIFLVVAIIMTIMHFITGKKAV